MQAQYMKETQKRGAQRLNLCQKFKILCDSIEQLEILKIQSFIYNN